MAFRVVQGLFSAVSTQTLTQVARRVDHGAGFAPPPPRQACVCFQVWKRFTKMKDALLTDEQETAQLVVSNLKVFFHELRRKYHGRFPNMVRAIQQGVCSAIVTATPRGSLGKIAQVTGASHSHLRAAYNRWHDWMLDDVDDLVELRGAVRSIGQDSEGMGGPCDSAMVLVLRQVTKDKRLSAQPER